MLILSLLVASSLGCKPALLFPREITYLLSPELAKRMGVQAAALPVPVLADEPKPLVIEAEEGSGEEPKAMVTVVRSLSVSCAHSGKVELVTSYPWDESKLNEYGANVEHDFHRLQRYSRTSVASFGGRMTRRVVKLPTASGLLYGQRFSVEGLTPSCQAVYAFVRKAVSWSSTIPRATVSCRCERPLIIQKI